jgi:hypothetical protein
MTSLCDPLNTRISLLELIVSKDSYDLLDKPYSPVRLFARFLRKCPNVRKNVPEVFKRVFSRNLPEKLLEMGQTSLIREGDIFR